MARIRTIKPDFFTSEDICGLTVLARLLYIATWLEADREGRFAWKPNTFKLRYLPGDDCDILELFDELLNKSLIFLYEFDGKTFAAIPTFTQHQVINNRESASELPSPRDDHATIIRRTRDSDASSTRESRDDNAIPTPLVGRERKGKEGKGRERNKTAQPMAALASLEKFDPTAMSLPECINREIWVEWISYRKSRRLVTAEPTLQKQIKNLVAWFEIGHWPDAIIHASIANGWQGLFEPKANGGSPTRGTGNRQIDLEERNRQVVEEYFSKQETIIETSSTEKPERWWETPEGIATKAAELGLPAHADESAIAHCQRLVEHVRLGLDKAKNPA